MAPQVLKNYGTACVQKLGHRRLDLQNREVPQFLNAYGGVKLFAVLFNHYNAQVSCKNRTAQAGLILAHKKCEFCILFAQNGCLTIITLLRAPKIVT